MLLHDVHAGGGRPAAGEPGLNVACREHGLGCAASRGRSEAGASGACLVVRHCATHAELGNLGAGKDTQQGVSTKHMLDAWQGASYTRPCPYLEDSWEPRNCWLHCIGGHAYQLASACCIMRPQLKTGCNELRLLSPQPATCPRMLSAACAPATATVHQCSSPAAHATAATAAMHLAATAQELRMLLAAHAPGMEETSQPFVNNPHLRRGLLPHPGDSSLHEQPSPAVRSAAIAGRQRPPASRQ